MGVKDISIYHVESLRLTGRCNLQATACAANSTELIKARAEYTAALVHQSLKV